MEKQDKNNLFFMDSVQDYKAMGDDRCALHILCISGSLRFSFQNVHYNIVSGDYAILTNMALASGFVASDDYRGIAMGVADSLVMSMVIRNDYGIIGHLGLLQNPVMKLAPDEFRKCQADMERIRERMADEDHHFHKEMISYLLTAHILDLYDIHARNREAFQVSEHTAHILRKFIELLRSGAYINHRNVSYYADALCITPHYLTEICRNVSGKPATYWIERFTLYEIARLLRQKGTSMTEIANHLNFSSVSYFSRYVQKRLGVYPTAYRKTEASAW